MVLEPAVCSLLCGPLRSEQSKWLFRTGANGWHEGLPGILARSSWRLVSPSSTVCTWLCRETELNANVTLVSLKSKSSARRAKRQAWKEPPGGVSRCDQPGALLLSRAGAGSPGWERVDVMLSVGSRSAPGKPACYASLCCCVAYSLTHSSSERLRCCCLPSHGLPLCVSSSILSWGHCSSGRHPPSCPAN